MISDLISVEYLSKFVAELWDEWNGDPIFIFGKMWFLVFIILLFSLSFFDDILNMVFRVTVCGKCIGYCS